MFDRFCQLIEAIRFEQINPVEVPKIKLQFGEAKIGHLAIVYLHDLEALIDTAVATSEDIEGEIGTFQAELEALRQKLDFARSCLVEIEKNAPGWLSRLFRPKRYQQYCEDQQARENDLENARSSVSSVEASVHACLDRKAETARNLVKLENKKASCNRSIKDLRDQLSPFIAEGLRLGGAAFWRREGDDLQKQLPWSHPAVQAARAKLFVKAMELHEALAWAAKGQYKRNLHLALDLIRHCS